jgi:hypothetical protein
VHQVDAIALVSILLMIEALLRMDIRSVMVKDLT